MLCYVGSDPESSLFKSAKVKDCCTVEQCTKWPRPEGHIWRDIRVNQNDVIGKVLKAFGWGRKHVRDIHKKANNPWQRGLHKRTKLPTLPPACKARWWRDLTEDGDVEPHPNPAVAKL